MSEDLIYIYCVTGGIPELDSIPKEDGKDVYCIFHKGLCAVVSEVLPDEFGEDMLKKNLNDITWLESRVRKHEGVIEKVMERSAVIPFKFATIFKAEDSLKTMIENFLDEFKDILNRIEGRNEWGVKIYCDMEKFKTAVVRKDDQILRMEEEIKSSGIGKAYFLNKKREELIDDSTNKVITGYRMGIRETLLEHSNDARPVKLLPKEATGRKDEMILNAAFLIDKTKLGGFINSINYLKEKYKDIGFDFDYTGPWPPYNFCSIGTAKGINETTSFSSEKEPNGSLIFNKAKKEKAV